MRYTDKNTYNSINKKINRDTRCVPFFAGMLTSGLYLHVPFSEVVGTIGILSSYSFKNYHKSLIKNCDEFEQLRDYYDCITELISSSIKSLNLESVTEVFTYMSYLYENGYLSYNRSKDGFVSNRILSRDTILKELALNNHGGSKSAALLVSDIINYTVKDTSTSILDGVLHDEYEMAAKIEESNIEEYINDFIETLKRKQTKVLTYNRQELIEYLISNGIIKVNDKVKKKEIDYTISTALHNDQQYYLDIQNSQILYPVENNSNILVGNNIAFTIAGNSLKNQETSRIDINKSEKELNKAKEIIQANEQAIEELYNLIQPKLESAENTHEKILRSC
ncbi:MAG: hypothetical protein J1F35_01120 [Erysipelotrichales bacterium]|nr:hypothetical protein [Erysipelotrichales bacterium]